jgi:hypothetical protein
VHVLVGEQHRLRCREPFELLNQRRQRQLLLALRGHFRQPVALADGDAEQGRDQRHRLVEPVRAQRQKRLQFGQLHLGRLIALKAGGALQLLDQRMQRTGRVVGRTLVEQTDVGLVGQPRAQLADQTRLANPRLAGHEDDMPFAVFGLLPSPQQQRDLLLAPD